jgi:hypothetical protein
MSRLQMSVGGDVESFYPNAAHAGDYPTELAALIVDGPDGPVTCLASGEAAARLAVLEPGDGVFVTGKPVIARDLDGRVIVALVVERWELLQARADAAPNIWRLRLALLVNAICGWVERRLAARGENWRAI